MSKSTAFQEDVAHAPPLRRTSSAPGLLDESTMLGASVCRRLAWLGLLIALLWGGVYWALN
jgi:hypothetical protein